MRNLPRRLFSWHDLIDPPLPAFLLSMCVALAENESNLSDLYSMCCARRQIVVRLLRSDHLPDQENREWAPFLSRPCSYNVLGWFVAARLRVNEYDNSYFSQVPDLIALFLIGEMKFPAWIQLLARMKIVLVVFRRRKLAVKSQQRMLCRGIARGARLISFSVFLIIIL